MFCRFALKMKTLRKKCFAEFLLFYPHDFISNEKIFTKILQHCAHCISDGAWAKKFSFFFMFCRCSLTALWHAKQLEKKCFAEFLLLYPHDFTSDEKIFTKILQHCAHCISDGAWAKKFSFFFMFCRCSLTALWHAKQLEKKGSTAKWRYSIYIRTVSS